MKFCFVKLSLQREKGVNILCFGWKIQCFQTFKTKKQLFFKKSSYFLVIEKSRIFKKYQLSFLKADNTVDKYSRQFLCFVLLLIELDKLSVNPLRKRRQFKFLDTN